MFKEIEECIKSNSNIADMIVAGDMNQSTRSKPAQSFFENAGAIDACYEYNDIEMQQLDYAESRGF